MNNPHCMTACNAGLQVLNLGPRDRDSRQPCFACSRHTPLIKPPTKLQFGDWREYSCQLAAGKSEWDRTPEIRDEWRAMCDRKLWRKSDHLQNPVFCGFSRSRVFKSQISGRPEGLVFGSCDHFHPWSRLTRDHRGPGYSPDPFAAKARRPEAVKTLSLGSENRRLLPRAVLIVSDFKRYRDR